MIKVNWSLCDSSTMADIKYVEEDYRDTPDMQSYIKVVYQEQCII